MAEVLVCDPVHEDGIALLEEAGHRVTVRIGIDREELLSEVQRFHAMIVRSATRVDKQVLQRGTNLRAIGRPGVGLDNIDTETAKEMGIDVVSTPAAPTDSVAQMAIGLMISLARKIPQADASTKSGRWEKKKFLGTELADKTLGIVGFGRIGRRVCDVALAMGLDVVTYEILEVSEEYKQRGVRQVELETLLPSADVVTLHVPLTKQTRHMIDSDALEAMKRGAFLVNTSRGAVIDTAALKAALERGKIAGAGLDVFEAEPPEDEELLSLENVVLTPHISSQTVEAQRKSAVEVARRLDEALETSGR